MAEAIDLPAGFDAIWVYAILVGGMVRGAIAVLLEADASTGLRGAERLLPATLQGHG